MKESRVTLPVAAAVAGATGSWLGGIRLLVSPPTSGPAQPVCLADAVSVLLSELLLSLVGRGVADAAESLPEDGRGCAPVHPGAVQETRGAEMRSRMSPSSCFLPQPPGV